MVSPSNHPATACCSSESLVGNLSTGRRWTGVVVLAILWSSHYNRLAADGFPFHLVFMPMVKLNMYRFGQAATPGSSLPTSSDRIPIKPTALEPPSFYLPRILYERNRFITPYSTPSSSRN